MTKGNSQRDRCSCEPSTANFPSNQGMRAMVLKVDLSKPVDSAPFIEKIVLFPQRLLQCHLCHRSSDRTRGSHFEPYSVPAVSLFLHEPIPQHSHYCSLILSVDSRDILLFKFILANLINSILLFSVLSPWKSFTSFFLMLL